MKKILIVPLLIIMAQAVACRKVSNEEMSGNKPAGNFTIEVTSVVTKEHTIETSEVTEEAASTQETITVLSTASTSESAISTNEANADSSVYFYVASQCLLLTLDNGVVKDKRTLRYGEPLKVTEKVMINGTNFQQEAYNVVDKYGQTGFVYTFYLCPDRICAKADRWGIIETYSHEEMQNVYIPQMRIIFQNLYETPLSELHVMAIFSYKGKEIGVDSTHAVSDMLGITPLDPGDSKKVILRPSFSLDEGEVVSPDNPVVVNVKCSAKFEPYKDCGEFKIDHMYY